jgi:dienelactone hydrolase
LALVAGVVALAAVRADDKMEDDRVERARAFVAALVKSDYKAAAKDFDDDMLKAFPGDMLEKFWKDLIETAGALKKQGAAKKGKSDKYDIVVVTCEFEKTSLDVRLVFDPDGKIGGLFVRPPTHEYQAPSYVKPDLFRETDVTVTTGDYSLPGTLTLPKGDGPFPAVVLVHGSGPNDRDETIGPNKMLRDLAWGLASRGVAVLRYDKRTLLMAKRLVKTPDSLTLKEETVEDAASAVQLLAKQKEIDNKRIFLLGHSLGGYAAPRIAEAAPDVAGLILMAANSRPLEDLIIEQVTYIHSLQKPPDEKQKETLDLLKKQVERVKDPKLSADTPAAELPFGAPAPYWLDLRKYDATGTAANLKQPMLILHGERDYQVTMADFDGWKKALADHKNVRLKSYPKLNHLFMDGDGKATPSEYEKAGHVAVDVIDETADWIKKQ